MADARILVASDVHGFDTGLRWLLRNEKADALFFLGDGLRDLDRALELERARDPGAAAFPCYRVRGNCDPGYPDPSEGLAPFAGVLFFFTHGHLYGVKSGTETLAEAAAARGADVALYGHTHHPNLIPALPAAGRPALFNPGSLLTTGSYGIVTVEGGRCRFTWRRVPL